MDQRVGRARRTAWGIREGAAAIVVENAGGRERRGNTRDRADQEAGIGIRQEVGDHRVLDRADAVVVGQHGILQRITGRDIPGAIGIDHQLCALAELGNRQRQHRVAEIEEGILRPRDTGVLAVDHRQAMVVVLRGDDRTGHIVIGGIADSYHLAAVEQDARVRGQFVIAVGTGSLQHAVAVGIELIGCTIAVQIGEDQRAVLGGLGIRRAAVHHTSEIRCCTAGRPAQHHPRAEIAGRHQRVAPVEVGAVVAERGRIDRRDSRERPGRRQMDTIGVRTRDRTGPGSPGGEAQLQVAASRAWWDRDRPAATDILVCDRQWGRARVIDVDIDIGGQVAVILRWEIAHRTIVRASEEARDRAPVFVEPALDRDQRVRAPGIGRATVAGPYLHLHRQRRLDLGTADEREALLVGRAAYIGRLAGVDRPHKIEDAVGVCIDLDHRPIVGRHDLDADVVVVAEALQPALPDILTDRDDIAAAPIRDLRHLPRAGQPRAGVGQPRGAHRLCRLADDRDPVAAIKQKVGCRARDGEIVLPRLHLPGCQVRKNQRRRARRRWIGIVAIFPVIVIDRRAVRARSHCDRRSDRGRNVGVVQAGGPQHIGERLV